MPMEIYVWDQTIWYETNNVQQYEDIYYVKNCGKIRRSALAFTVLITNFHRGTGKTC